MLHCFKNCTVKTFATSNYTRFIEIVEKTKSTMFAANAIVRISKFENTIAIYIAYLDNPTVVSLNSDEEGTRFYNIMKSCMMEYV